MDGRIIIHCHDGHSAKLRRGIHYWLSLVRNNCNEQLIEKIDSSPQGHRAAVLRWLCMNIMMKDMTEEVEALEVLIRYSFTSTSNSEKRTGETRAFIKIVHAHEVNVATNIKNILHDKESLRLLKIEDNDVPFICDKQVASLSHSLCNFTKTARNLPFNDIQPELPPGQCPCRIFFPYCTDLVNNHVMTANTDICHEPQVRLLFKYGTKFRVNMMEKEIVEAVEIGVNEYLNKLLEHLQPHDHVRRVELTQ